MTSTNLGVLLVLVAVGFWWMLFFNSITNKLYGDHCADDKDCATDMNYICQIGKCGCTSDTFYLSASAGCGRNCFDFFNTGNFYAIEFFFVSKLHKKRMEKRVVVRVNVVVVYIVRGHVIVRGIDGGILIFPIVVITF